MLQSSLLEALGVTKLATGAGACHGRSIPRAKRQEAWQSNLFLSFLDDDEKVPFLWILGKGSGEGVGGKAWRWVLPLFITIRDHSTGTSTAK